MEQKLSMRPRNGTFFPHFQQQSERHGNVCFTSKCIFLLSHATDTSSFPSTVYSFTYLSATMNTLLAGAGVPGSARTNESRGAAFLLAAATGELLSTGTDNAHPGYEDYLDLTRSISNGDGSYSRNQEDAASIDPDTISP